MIAAKSLVAFLDPCTIPRLELQTAVMRVRLAETIIDEHEFTIARKVYWSDFKTVLRWIWTDLCSYRTFDMNRLGKVVRKIKSFEWRWVDTLNNPADDATRLAPDALELRSR